MTVAFLLARFLRGALPRFLDLNQEGERSGLASKPAGIDGNDIDNDAYSGARGRPVGRYRGGVAFLNERNPGASPSY